MATYQYTANLILSQLRQVFDDRKTTFNQVVYWIQVVSNRLRYLRLNKRSADTGIYLNIFSNIEIKTSGNKKYIELPADIIEIDKDGGIEYIAYSPEQEDNCDDNLYIQFERTNPSSVQSLLRIPVRSPKPSSPFFYRASDRIYLLGIECVEVKDLEIGLHTSVNPKNICDITEEVPIDNSLEEALITRVISLCRFGLMIDEERKNDGSDNIAEQSNKTALTNLDIQQQPQQEQ